MMNLHEMLLNTRRMAPATLAACVLCCGAASAQTPKQDQRQLVLKDVSVVDTHTGHVEPGMNVVIEGGKIVRVSRQSIKLGRSSQVVDGTGKFVVPGYWEMHAHPLDSAQRADNLALMLANGITGFRQMSGSDALLAERRAVTLMPTSDTPELLAMPGSILLRNNAGTIPQAIAEVDKQKAEGANFIKTIEVPVPVFFAALDQATKDGLIYDGHLSTAVDAVKASEAGMRAIEHLGPQELILIGCSTDEVAIRVAVAQRAQAGAPNMASAITNLNRVAAANPTLLRAIADPTGFTRLQHVLDTYSDEKCHRVAKVFATHKTWQVPTLVRLRTAEFGDDPLYSSDPNLKYVDMGTRELWAGILTQFSAQITAANKETLRQFYAMQLKLAKVFEDEGVPMLAGSDFGGMWLVAGFSLHQEFDQLALAGLTPLRVLQMTTLNAAQFLGRESTDGSVAGGMNANLVLLSGNPVASVQNLHKITGVVHDGKFYSTEALAGLKHKVLDDMAATPKEAAQKVTP